MRWLGPRALLLLQMFFILVVASTDNYVRIIFIYLHLVDKQNRVEIVGENLVTVEMVIQSIFMFTKN